MLLHHGNCLHIMGKINVYNIYIESSRSLYLWGRRDRMVVGFTATYAISVYHHDVVASNPG